MYKREGRLRPSAYMKIKGRLRPIRYKKRLRLPSAYNTKGCKEESSEVLLKLGLLKNDAEGSLYRLEEALDSSEDLLESRKVKYFYLQVNFFFSRK